jgi:Thioredoxin like C-terminal domain
VGGHSSSVNHIVKLPRLTSAASYCGQFVIRYLALGILDQLVRQAGAITDHPFKIRFRDPGVQAYAFTFGRADRGTRQQSSDLGMAQLYSRRPLLRRDPIPVRPVIAK